MNNVMCHLQSTSTVLLEFLYSCQYFSFLLPHPSLPDTIVKILLFFLLKCLPYYNYHIIIFSFVLFSLHQHARIFSLLCLSWYPLKTSLLFMYSCENSFLNIIPHFSKEKTLLPNFLPNLEYIYFKL